MLKVLNNVKGSGLMMVLIVMMLLAVLGTAALATMGAEGRQSAMHDNKTQAYYLARSGAEIAHEWLKKQDYTLTNEINLTGDLQNLQPGKDLNNPINVSIKKDAEKILINSIGNYNKAIETNIIQVEYKSDIQVTSFTHALFAANKIDLGGSASITGSVAANLTSGSQIVLGHITGDLWVLSPITKTQTGGTITGKINVLGEPLAFPMPVFPEFPTLTNLTNPGNNTLDLNGDYHISGELKSSTIKVGNQDRKLVVDTLDLNGLTLEGTGKLTIYVKNELKLRGNINTASKIDQLIIYLKGSGTETPKTVTISNADIYASIHAEDANILLSNTNAKLFGHLITGGKDVQLQGNSSANIQAIYAPNAHVDLRGGAKVRGVVVSKTLSMQGNTSIDYGDLSNDHTLETMIETKTYQMMWR